MLIAQIHEKKAAPPTTMQNVQMMRSEPCNDEPMVNMVVRSGIAIGEVNGKTNMEARESFTGVSTQGSRDGPELDRDPSTLGTLLETCIKLLHDNREVRGLQEVMNRCVGKIRKTRIADRSGNAVNGIHWRLGDGSGHFGPRFECKRIT